MTYENDFKVALETVNKEESDFNKLFEPLEKEFNELKKVLEYNFIYIDSKRQVNKKVKNYILFKKETSSITYEFKEVPLFSLYIKKKFLHNGHPYMLVSFGRTSMYQILMSIGTIDELSNTVYFIEPDMRSSNESPSKNIMYSDYMCNFFFYFYDTKKLNKVKFFSQLIKDKKQFLLENKEKLLESARRTHTDIPEL